MSCTIVALDMLAYIQNCPNSLCERVATGPAATVRSSTLACLATDLAATQIDTESLRWRFY